MLYSYLKNGRHPLTNFKTKIQTPFCCRFSFSSRVHFPEDFSHFRNQIGFLSKMIYRKWRKTKRFMHRTKFQSHTHIFFLFLSLSLCLCFCLVKIIMKIYETDLVSWSAWHMKMVFFYVMCSLCANTFSIWTFFHAFRSFSERFLSLLILHILYVDFFRFFFCCWLVRVDSK